MLTRADACGGGPASMSSVRSCPVRSPQLGDGLVEVVDGTERLVHACEAQVGDLVELAQRTQDGEPDLVAGHLSGTGRPDRLFDGLRQLSQRVLVDRPALASPAHAVDDLQPAERLGDPAALDHRERGLLDGREPAPAVLAATTAANDLALVVLARIDDPRIGMAAVRTPHFRFASSVPSWGGRHRCVDLSLGTSCGPAVDDSPQPVDRYPQIVDDLHQCNYYM